MNLQDACLFYPITNKPSWDWEKVSKAYYLIESINDEGKVVENTNWMDPSDYRFVHNGYAPLSVRVL